MAEQNYLQLSRLAYSENIQRFPLMKNVRRVIRGCYKNTDLLDNFVNKLTHNGLNVSFGNDHEAV